MTSSTPRIAPSITPNYLEIAATDLDATKRFYTRAFGFSFTDYGPGYTAVEGGPVELGFSLSTTTEPPLPTFETDDLEGALAAVKAAGGDVVKDIFAYPGGRRFECTDPAGNRIGIYQKA
jgi:predicted enzyme related to lactoylglutathione lyase